MRAQHLGLFALARLQIESVVHCARGMALGHVERGEIVPLVLDLGPGRYREAEVGEDLRHLVEHLADRMDRPLRRRVGGERHVDRLAREPRVELGTVERGLARGDRGGHRLAHALDARTFHQPLIGRHLAERLEQRGDAALLAEQRDTERLELRRVGLADRRQLRFNLGKVSHVHLRHSRERGKPLARP